MLKIPAIRRRAIGIARGAIRSNADPGFVPDPGGHGARQDGPVGPGHVLCGHPGRATGPEAGQYLASAVDGDRIRAGRADFS